MDFFTFLSIYLHWQMCSFAGRMRSFSIAHLPHMYGNSEYAVLREYMRSFSCDGGGGGGGVGEYAVLRSEFAVFYRFCSISGFILDICFVKCKLFIIIHLAICK